MDTTELYFCISRLTFELCLEGCYYSVNFGFINKYFSFAGMYK